MASNSKQATCIPQLAMDAAVLRIGSCNKDGAVTCEAGLLITWSKLRVIHGPPV